MANKFTEITQVGIVVRDREKVISGMREIFGEEPTQTIKTLRDENNLYYGEPEDFQAELIFYRFANVELEFIVPLKGKSIWQDFLDERGEGIHHVLFNVDSYDGAKKQMTDKGIEIMQQGPSVMGIPGLNWAYFDTTDKITFITEMKNSKEIL